MMIHVRLPEDIRQKFKAVTALENKSMTQVIGDLITAYLRDKRELK